MSIYLCSIVFCGMFQYSTCKYVSHERFNCTPIYQYIVIYYGYKYTDISVHMVVFNSSCN